MVEKCIYEYERTDKQRGCRYKSESNDLCNQIDPIDPEKCDIITRIKDWNSRVAQSQAKYKDPKEIPLPCQVCERKNKYDKCPDRNNCHALDGDHAGLNVQPSSLRTKSERCSCGGVETVISSPIDTAETCKSCGMIKKD